MPGHRLLAAALLLTTIANARAEPSPRLGASMGGQIGSRSHGLSAAFDPSVGSDVEVSSALAWPVDFVLFGVHGEVPIGGSASLALSAQSNALGPWRTMDDSDWLASEDLDIPRTKFIYTESRTEARIYIGEAAIRWDSLAPGWRAAIGYRHEHYRAEAFGGEGWFLGETGQREDLELDSGVLVVRVASHQALPYVGMRFQEWAEARAMLVYSHHYDDHVLRGKDSRSDGVGVGMGVALQPRWALGAFRVGINADMDLFGALIGTVRQEFYADDPNTAADELLLDIPDADYTLLAWRVGALAVLELVL